jgi:hypothetical protein
MPFYVDAYLAFMPISQLHQPQCLTTTASTRLSPTVTPTTMPKPFHHCSIPTTTMTILHYNSFNHNNHHTLPTIVATSTLQEPTMLLLTFALITLPLQMIVVVTMPIVTLSYPTPG